MDREHTTRWRADGDATRAELAAAQECPTVLTAKCHNLSRIVTRAHAPRQAAAAAGAEQLAAAEEELRRLHSSLVLPQVCIVCRMMTRAARIACITVTRC